MTVYTCPVCGESGDYWEDRVQLPPHVSVTGFEIRAAGWTHPDGRTCSDADAPVVGVLPVEDDEQSQRLGGITW